MGGGRDKDEMLDDFGPRATARLRERRLVGWFSAVEVEVHPSGKEEKGRFTLTVKRQETGGEPVVVAIEDFEGSLADAARRGSDLIRRDIDRLFPHL